jgi:hypothetical protein
MKPGWLILFFLLSGTPGAEPRAESTAPAYKIIRAQTHSVQSVGVQQMADQANGNTLVQAQQDLPYLLVVGQNPTFELEFADVKDRSGTGR